jgi:hypothetical protein
MTQLIGNDLKADWKQSETLEAVWCSPEFSLQPANARRAGLSTNPNDCSSRSRRNTAMWVAMAKALVRCLNNVLEQDHQAIKRPLKAKQSFREFQAVQYRPHHPTSDIIGLSLRSNGSTQLFC